MSSKVLLSATLSLACLLYAATPASASLLLSYEGGANNNSNPGEAIQFAGAAGTTYTLSTFNWDTGTGTSETAYAYGTLYVIATSLSNALSSSGVDSGLTSTDSSLGGASGLVAKATASGNLYTFSPGVTLNAGTTYFFFTAGNTNGEDATGGTETNTGTATANVTRYRVPGSSIPGYPDFVSGSGFNDFQLDGSVSVSTQSIAPEPSSLAMVGSGGLTGLAFAWRLRRRKTTAA